MIKTENLTAYYENFLALDDINVSIPSGSMTAVLGPNGAGKSTFIKCLLDLTTYKGNVILFDQKNISMKEKSQKIAYIPQYTHINNLFPISVLDIVLMGRYPYITNLLKRPSHLDKTIALNCLDTLGIADLAHKKITELSGGQKQRVFLARAIAQDATLYILDEPLANIDKLSEQIIMSHLRQLMAENKTIVIIHHDLNTVKDYFTHVIWLNHSLIAQGNIEDMFRAEYYEQTFLKDSKQDYTKGLHYDYFI